MKKDVVTKEIELSKKNRILIDWFSFTSVDSTPDDIQTMLGMAEFPWSEISGANGYKDRFYYDHISIHYNGRADMGVWCEMSGQGCRVFESIGHGDFDILIGGTLKNRDRMNITRFDVAYDDFEGIFDMNTIIDHVRNQLYISPMRKWKVIISSDGTSAEIGSVRSDILIRIYDKAAEQGISGKHWVRFEVQFRRKHASNFAYLDKPIGEKLVGILNNYLRFVELGEDSNKTRWETCIWWSEFIGEAEKISIYDKPGVEYGYDDLERYIFNQAGNSIFTYVKIFGFDRFQQQLNKRDFKLNEKQKSLISKLGTEEFKKYQKEKAGKTLFENMTKQV